MKTLIVGLGNPILSDDGVGWAVAREVKKQLGEASGVEVDCLSLGGISLMERMIGFDRAVLVDAFVCEEEPGSVLVFKLEDLPDRSAFHLTSAHDTSLQNAIQLGRQMGAKLPQEILVVGVSARQVYDFGEELSPPVLEGVPKATRMVVELLT